MLCAMTSWFKYVIWLFCISLSSCTDLAAVYRHKILILRDAHLILPNSTPSWESLSLALPRPLYFPVSLAQDTETNRLFVAEAKPKEEAKILSIFLNSEFKVDNMTAAVKGSSVSAIEGISYSPKSRHLFWTDASNHCIYKASVPSEPGSDASIPELIEDLGTTIKPRGLALDPCKELLYWSERGGEGMAASSVEMWDPNGNKHLIVQQDKGKDDFYQGLTFDDTSGNLVWAVTHGPDLNTTCRIVSTSKDGMHQELVNLENCYPFSLTVDENYVYWTDWNRQGIMRASRTDPSDIVMLVHTPHVTIKREQLFAYGLVKINSGNVGQNPCQVKRNKSKNQEEPLKPETIEERGKGTAEIKELHDDHKSANDDQNTEAEEIKHRTVDPTESKGKNEGKVTSPASIGHSDTEEIEMNKDNKAHEDQIVKVLRVADSPSLEPEQKATLQLVNTTRVNNDKTQAGMFASQSTDEVPTTECIFGYNEGKLMTIIVILAVISVGLLISTITLAVKMWCTKAVPCKGTSAATRDAPQAVIVQPQRQVKRFGPKKSFVSRNKSGLARSSTCSALTNDGVSINIEDCCQMTLCETPCYTTVKKQGKSYKDIRQKAKTYEDKKGLLDDSEEI